MQNSEPSQNESAVIDDVLSALRGPETLEMLGITNAELDQGRGDADVEETLRILYELLIVLRTGGVLGAFLALPKGHQANFLRWVASTDGEQVRRDRSDTLLSALQASPLAGSSA